MTEIVTLQADQLPLCATPPRDVLAEFFSDHILSGSSLTPQYQQYQDIFTSSGRDAALKQLENDVHIRAVTINYARIKSWHSIGTDPNKWIIGVRFDGADDSLKKFVLDTVKQWERALDGRIQFSEHDHSSSLTVKFIGNDSYHHTTRTLSIPTAQYHGSSLHNAAVNMVLHEFGHALGFEHEHFSQSCKEHFDFKSAAEIAKTIDGWGENNVKNQITEGKAVNVCGTPHGCDVDSVMIYPVDKNWSKKSKSAIRNPKLSEHDIACVRILYGLN